MKALSLVVAMGMLAATVMAPPASASSIQEATKAEIAAMKAENAARKVAAKAEKLAKAAERKGTKGAVRAAEKAQAAANIAAMKADAAAERAAQLKAELFGGAPEDHFGGQPGSYPNGRGWQAVKRDFEQVDAALASIDEKIDILDGKLDALDAKVDTLGEKVEMLQSSIDDVASAVADLDTALGSLEGKVDAMQLTVNALAAELATTKSQIADVQASLDAQVDVEVAISTASAVDGNDANVQALVRVEQLSAGVAGLEAAAFTAGNGQIVPPGCSAMSVDQVQPLGPTGSYVLHLVPAAPGALWCTGTYIMTLVVETGTGLGGALAKVEIPAAGP